MSAFQRHQHVHTPGSLLGFHRVAPMCSPPGTPQCTSVFSIDNTFSAASSLEREDGLRCVSLSLSDNTCTKPEQCVVPHEKTQRTVRGELLSSTASSPSTAQNADDVRTNPNEAKPAAGNASPVPLLAGRPRVSGRRPFSPGPRFELAPKKAGRREATGTQGWWQVNMEAARGQGCFKSTSRVTYFGEASARVGRRFPEILEICNDFWVSPSEPPSSGPPRWSEVASLPHAPAPLQTVV